MPSLTLHGALPPMAGSRLNTQTNTDLYKDLYLENNKKKELEI